MVSVAIVQPIRAGRAVILPLVVSADEPRGKRAGAWAGPYSANCGFHGS